MRGWKPGFPWAGQLWADRATQCDKLECALASLTRTIRTLPTRVMLGMSDATFCCYFSFTPSSLLTKLHHKKKKNVRNISFSGGVRKYCCSEQERTKSVPEPICRSLKSLRIVIENRCQNLMSLMSLMAHQQSNQQHKAISEWKLSHSERLTLDIWFDTYKAPWKHPCKWRNSVHPSEYINDTYVIPEVVGFQKVSLDSHPPRLPGMLHPNLHIRKENF